MASTREPVQPHPLDGVTILVFTWSVAGPTMTRYLGGFGARVLKVEWPTGPDPMRTSMFAVGRDENTLDTSSFFGNLNIGKESLVLNVKDERGKRVIEELVSKADVVAESFSSGVLRSWGLSFERMRELNPRIVYVSISGFGHDGPHSTKNTWGPTAQAMSGMTSLAGVPGRDPSGWGYSYLDVTAGYMGAIGVMAALRTARRTGEAIRLDLSQVETGLALIGPALTDYLSTGTRPPETYPGGNASTDDQGRDVGFRGDTAVISDLFPANGAGDNDWVAVTIRAEDELKALLDLLAAPVEPWAAGVMRGDDEYIGLTVQAIAHYTRKRDKYLAAAELSAVGVPAAPVQGAEDRVRHDPQLQARGLLGEDPHPMIGDLLVQQLPIRSKGADRPWGFTAKFPLLGKDTKRILREFLGYSEAKISDLDEQGVLWPAGVPDEIAVERSLW